MTPGCYSDARLGLLLKPTPWFKFYVQGQDSREIDSDRPNEPGVLGAEGDDTFDFRQALYRARRLQRALRQARPPAVLSYGDERLIGPLDWNNFSRSWDAAKLRYAKRERGALDAFAGSLVKIADDQLDRSTRSTMKACARNQVLSGLYFSTHRAGLPNHRPLCALICMKDSAAGDSDFVHLRHPHGRALPRPVGAWDYDGGVRRSDRRCEGQGPRRLLLVMSKRGLHL